MQTVLQDHALPFCHALHFVLRMMYFCCSLPVIVSIAGSSFWQRSLRSHAVT